jgi:hypothetical protein
MRKSNVGQGVKHPPAELIRSRILARTQGRLASAQQIVVLKPYEEVIGALNKLEAYNRMLLAEIGRIVVTLPIDLKDELTPNLNRRIAILRTDIPGKEYLFRTIREEEKHD